MTNKKRFLTALIVLLLVRVADAQTKETAPPEKNYRCRVRSFAFWTTRHS